MPAPPPQWIEKDVSGPSQRSLVLVGAQPDKPLLAMNLLPTPCRTQDELPMLATVELADWWEAVGREACCAEPGDRLPLVHLWEDEWRARQPIVHSRLLAMAGRSRRLMARKLQVRRIDAATLEGFLLQHHLWGPTQARFRYGLFTKPSGPEGEEGEELVAVASFSARRNVQRAGRR